jgi:hypothetical protein
VPLRGLLEFIHVARAKLYARLIMFDMKANAKAICPQETEGWCPGMSSNVFG